MFLDKKSKKSKPVNKAKVRERVSRNSLSLTKNQYITNQIIRVSVPKSIFAGEADDEKVVKEEISVRIFSTESARVGAQWMWSKEVDTGLEVKEWYGFRIYIEVPCYVERLVETQREVVEEVKREGEQQLREFISKLARRDFGDKDVQATLGLS